MVHYRKRIQAVLFVTVLAMVSQGPSVWAKDCPSGTHEDPAGLMTADAALARPVGAVATVAGFAVFLVSSPFSALGGNTKEAWESLVTAPANYTFKRPLGHFDCEAYPSEKQR